MFGAPARAPRLGTLERWGKQTNDESSDTTDRPVTDPLVLDTPGKPRLCTLTGLKLGRIGGILNGLCDHRTLLHKCSELNMVSRATEEDERPALEVSLILRRYTEVQLDIMRTQRKKGRTRHDAGWTEGYHR